jgi:hypothetical protein
MIKLKSLLEGSNQTYDYGCVMLYFTFPEMDKIHSAINPSHVYTEEGDRSFGLEDEPHTTLLYGLHPEVSDNDIQSILDKYTFSTMKIHNASMFQNPSYDVLKFDVNGDNLHQCNADLRQYPHTSTFPDYHPHLTIGYMQPGSGQRYVDAFAGQKFWLSPQYAVYSKADGSKVRMPIKVD